MKIHTYAHVVCLAAFLTGMPVLSLAASHSPDAMQLLKSFAQKASDTESAANTFDATAQALHLSWQTQGALLENLKGDINRMGRTLADLQQVHDTLQPFEQKAIDDAVPLLRSLASDTTAALEFLSNNQQRLWQPEYRDDAHRIATDAARLSSKLNESVSLAKAKREEQRLEKELGVIASQTPQTLPAPPASAQ